MDQREHEISTAVKQLQSLQAERAHTYTLFEEGHKIYMNSKETRGFSDFQKLVQDVTQDFKRISLSIIELEKRLREKLQAERLADLIGSLQDREKEKLHLTAELQLKLKEAQDSLGQRSELEEEVTFIKEQLYRVKEDINECLEDIKYEVDF